VRVLNVHLRAVNTTTNYKTDIKMFNIRLFLFTSHYTFRSAETIIRWSTNTYVIELSIKMGQFFTFANNVII
jgi:hypothetical protein